MDKHTRYKQFSCCWVTRMRLESVKNSNDNDKLQQQIGTHDIRLTELNFNRHRVGSHFYLASGIKLN